jgi:hypothetical protein
MISNSQAVNQEKYMPELERNLDMNRPEDRARHIHEHMTFSIRREVLSQYEDMSTGGDGGSSGSYQEGEASIREEYYRYKSDDWFKDVLVAYKSLQRANKGVQL